MMKTSIIITFEIDEERTKEYEAYQKMKMPTLISVVKRIQSRIRKEITRYNLKDDILVTLPYDADTVDDFVDMLKITYELREPNVESG